jgi:ketosteroid isomerase-like protein
MDRRRFLAAASTPLAAGLAGCSDLESIVDNTTGTLSGEDSGPAAAVREFYTAVGDGDPAAAAALLHPDSDVSTADIEATTGQFSNATVERVTVLDRNETRAIVQTSVTLAGEGQEQTVEEALDLRRVDGSWRIYGTTDRETVGGDRNGNETTDTREDADGSGGPRGAARQFFRSLADGASERAVELIHPDAPDREALVSQTRETQELERFRFDEVVLVERSDDRALVELAYTFSQDGETERTGAVGVELLTAGGEWQVYRQTSAETVEPRETETPTPEEETPADVEGDPSEVARRFYRRVADGDSEGARGLLHPNSSEALETLAEQAPDVESFRFDEVAVVERGNDLAVVELAFTLSQDGETQSRAVGVVLRPAEGQWRVLRRVDAGTVEPRETETPTPEEETPADVVGDPSEVTRRFYTALSEGDATTVRSLVHPDGPLAQLSDEEIERASEADVDVTILRGGESDDRAVVEAELTVSRDGNTRTNTVRVELRPADGRWRVYEFR